MLQDLESYDPDYYSMHCRMIALDKNVFDHQFVGLQLINIRAQDKILEIGPVETNKITNKCKIEWINALGKCKERQSSKMSSSNDDCNNAVFSKETSSNNNEISVEPEKKKRKHGTVKHKCAFVGCTNDNTSSNVTFQRMPPPSKKEAPDHNGRIVNVERFYKKKHLRETTLSRCGLNKNDARELRTCNGHEIEIVKKDMKINRNGKDKSIKFELNVPSGKGMFNETNSTHSKGISSDRAAARMLNQIKNDEAASWKFALQQSFEEKSPSKQLINESMQSMLPSKIVSHAEKRKLQCTVVKKEKEPDSAPFVTPKSYSSDYIKIMTGFIDESLMLAFYVIMHNGDFDKLTKSMSKLTWFEEMCMCYEIMWGRSVSRWDDAVIKHGITTVKHMFKRHLVKVLSCKKSWPAFATFNEDLLLRKEKWNEKHRSSRITFWDNTNVSFLFQPTTALNQRITYSAYYAGNCAKGGVFIQLCGWMGVSHLWCGATSDSKYMEVTGMFDQQDKFSSHDLVGGKKIPFTNIFDKGYRVMLAAWQAGKQLIQQPTFATSDQKFTANETIRSASIATDRSGNERGVNVQKRSGFIKRGIKPSSCLKTMDDVWISWSFQSNFMFKPVL